MKTPRQIILARHREREPELDRARQAALHAIRVPQPGQPVRARVSLPVLGLLWAVFWRQAPIPARLSWLGLATAWAVILALNLAARDPAIVALRRAFSGPVPTLESVRAEQAWLRAMAGDGELEAWLPPRAPRPEPNRGTRGGRG